MRRYEAGVALPPRSHDELLAYKREWGIRHREEVRARSAKWHRENRERRNAHRHLLRLRAMKDPLPRHIRKMAEICAKYPKRRIQYEA